MLNINNTLLGGGSFDGGLNWNKKATSIDQCFKLYHIVDGEAIIVSENKQYELFKGEYYFINGFKIDIQRCPDSFSVNWLHFISDSVFLKQILSKLPVVVKLNADEIFILRDVFNSFDRFFSLIQPFKEKHPGDYFTLYLKIQSLLTTIISVFAEKFNPKIFDKEDTEVRLMPAIEHINENFKKGTSLKELASMCFLSDNYFHSLFKNVFGTTPNNYILQLRMNEAIRLLSNSRMPIKAVAHELGYDDSAYFTRTFSKYFGASPNKYRTTKHIRLP